MSIHVTFRQLRLFLALAATGSVSGAARSVHVTQPTASMQLREISAAVGVPLYEVIARRVHLTEAGNELVHAARAIASEWEAFGQKIDSIRGLTRGRLNVAVVSTAQYFIPRLLGDFCDRYHNVEIALEVLNRDGVVSRLRENRDDLYIMSMPPADLALEDHVFMPNPLVVVHASPPPTPLSITKLQSLSTPSQVSAAAVAALHADQPVASHAWVPQHVPSALTFEQLRIAPASSALHEQLRVTGWQKLPAWTPVSSAAHVYPVGQSVGTAHEVAHAPSPSSVRHTSPGHSASTAQGAHSRPLAGMHSEMSPCGNAAGRQS